ncbi:MAG: stage II sporulation protein R [Clostridia bacterium]|jgi:stage II sporulation protein R|nr:stage II sporulation protein R [Clostridia bacterium]MDO4382328.1 stage II sporulation protein R [Clostridia bacterium]
MKKLFNISNLKRFLVLIILFSIYVFICAFSYVNAVSANISSSVFRLHVIANSDSAEDQNLKYLVRDALIDYMNSVSKNSNSKDEAISIAYQHKSDFYKIAKKVINDNGYDYNVNISIGNFTFPTKNYGDISLPAGYYDALKVEIGNASGQNWWCVMFPPLCFVDISTGIVPEDSKETIKDSLHTEEYNLINNAQTADVKFKFKLLEFFQNIKLANN